MHQLLQGDALSLLTGMAPGTVDAVITDPPYNSGGRTSGERTTASARGKYVSSDAQHQLADFAGDNKDQRSYIYWLSMVLGECLRIAREGAVALVYCDWRQLPATSDALQAAGWTWRGVVVHHKPVARPRRGGFSQNTEYLLWGSNGAVLPDRNPVSLPGLVSGSQPRGQNRLHITQKPLDVMRQLVQICPRGGTVLDPFAGAGTTGVAALAEGRDFIGIELSPHYHAIASARLAEAERS
ncbi:site-specific DNA-methyltransferase (plasmid) [Amycolatopsis sp. FU40]|uniref:DNA-methyltransferase n=1 Tax=Amycolatopsis sp. FU40 TaxID=2914159 RepID=UPI001F35B202|nr:site-specific DNA-methyltransferase [Amycolatopsis sp. FU40]UKD50907.1 site-specific DNA-methyltransferase [Amycolatopsis sp. FU40]